MDFEYRPPNRLVTSKTLASPGRKQDWEVIEFAIENSQSAVAKRTLCANRCR